MRQLKRTIALYLVILATILPWSTAEALETFAKSGLVAEITSSSVTISGKEYRLRSSTQMVSSDASRKKVSDIKPDDIIYIKGIVLNGVYYIDKLVYETPVPS